MHVGSLMLLAPSGRKRRGSGVYEGIRRHIASRLHLAPVFSRKLAFMPMDLANPVWIDAPRVDLDHHIRHVQLPRPASEARLQSAVAKLHEGMLDRERPLWQFTVIEGLESGEIGFYAKIHHAALDGQGGIAVAQALLDVAPEPRAAPVAVQRDPRLAPTAARMIGAALRNSVAQYSRLLKAIPGAVRTAGQASALTLGSAGLGKRGLARGPRTRLNVAIGPQRVFATARIPLAEAKAIARRFDATLNDVVLAICAGALRRQFAADRSVLAQPMIAAVPASLRAAGDTTQANYVTMMLVGLGTQIADPVKRLAAIKESSTRAKSLTGTLKSAIPTDMPSLGVPWLMAAITPLYRAATAAKRIPVVANLIISNVPGPQMPLYLAGAELKAYYPVSAVAHGLALNITILSYNGSLDFGLVAAKKALPGLRALARRLHAAHAELSRKARVG